MGGRDPERRRRLATDPDALRDLLHGSAEFVATLYFDAGRSTSETVVVDHQHEVAKLPLVAMHIGHGADETGLLPAAPADARSRSR